MKPHDRPAAQAAVLQTTRAHRYGRSRRELHEIRNAHDPLAAGEMDVDWGAGLIRVVGDDATLQGDVVRALDAGAVICAGVVNATVLLRSVSVAAPSSR